MKRPARKKRGQALIETALIAILLCMLMGGALDFGLAYFTYQSLSNSALEAVSYAAMNPMTNASPPGKNDAEIQLRARNEPGPSTIPNRVRPVNLRDLDNDGTPDEAGDDIAARIIVDAVAQPGSARTDEHCSDYRPIGGCDMTVTMSYRYEPFFGRLIGVDEINIEVTRTQAIHD